jgi:hypothetical protein
MILLSLCEDAELIGPSIVLGRTMMQRDRKKQVRKWTDPGRQRGMTDKVEEQGH